MDSAIQPLNNQGLVDSVAHLLNKWGQVNKIVRSTLKFSLLQCKDFVGTICSQNPNRGSNGLGTLLKNYSTFYAGIHCIPFISTKKKKIKPC